MTRSGSCGRRVVVDEEVAVVPLHRREEIPEAAHRRRRIPSPVSRRRSASAGEHQGAAAQRRAAAFHQRGPVGLRVEPVEHPRRAAVGGIPVRGRRRCAPRLGTAPASRPHGGPRNSRPGRLRSRRRRTYRTPRELVGDDPVRRGRRPSHAPRPSVRGHASGAATVRPRRRGRSHSPRGGPRPTGRHGLHPAAILPGRTGGAGLAGIVASPPQARDAAADMSLGEEVRRTTPRSSRPTRKGSKKC